MAEYPDIQKGTRFQDTKSSEWQKLTGDVQKKHDERTPTKELELQTSDRDRRVAVVKAVDPEADVSISVREIHYDPSGWPRAGVYVWGREFQAYPDIGAELDDYNGFHWRGDDPTLDTPKLIAHWTDGYWLLELSQPQERLVVLREFFTNDPGSFFAMVQEVVPTIGDDGAWTTEWETLGVAFMVNVWPTMVAGDYAPFVWTADQIDKRLTTLLPLAWYRGVWYLKQRPKWPVIRRKGPVKQLDCVPAFAEVP